MATQRRSSSTPTPPPPAPWTPPPVRAPARLAQGRCPRIRISPRLHAHRHPEIPAQWMNHVLVKDELWGLAVQRPETHKKLQAYLHCFGGVAEPQQGLCRDHHH